MMNQRLSLERRPVGDVCLEDFAIRELEIPSLAAGEFLVRNQYISIDPAMRGWMQDRVSYFPPVALGDAMRGLTVGRVEASRHPAYAVGDLVTGMLNLQTHSVSDGFQIRKIDDTDAPVSSWLGGLGMPGITGYFGIVDVGRPEPGDTVLVSAAAGAVGSIAGQVGKCLGCRVVGLAGSDEKCAFLTERLGFDAAINYRTAVVADALREVCPNGVDVYFDNVAGLTLDTVLPVMNRFGRIAFCGMISCMDGRPMQLTNISSLLVNRIRLQGFIMSDYVPRLNEAVGQITEWYRKGRLVFTEDVRSGTLEDFPQMLRALFEGSNFGKLILRIA